MPHVLNISLEKNCISLAFYLVLSHSMAASPSSSSKVNCPSCSNEIAYSLLNDHLDRCLSAGDLPHQAGDKPAEERTSNIPTPSKTQSTSNSSPTIPKLKTENAIRDSTLGLKRLSNSTSQNSNSHKKSRFNPAPSTSTTSIASTSSSSKPDVSTFDTSEVQQSAPITTKSRMEAAAPLAERLRPRSLDEFLVSSTGLAARPSTQRKMARFREGTT